MAQQNRIEKIKAIWRRLFRGKAYRDAYASKIIGNRLSSQIHSMREGKNWNQSELAERAGMRQSRISKLEHSCEDVSLNTLKRIASAFDVALMVKFVPFGELVMESATRNSDVEIASFDQDRDPSEPAMSGLAISFAIASGSAISGSSISTAANHVHVPQTSASGTEGKIYGNTVH